MQRSLSRWIPTATAVAVFAVWASLVSAKPPAGPPNVVLIFADDLGYGDLGCQGATKVQTPHIDRLAAEGRRFSDAHSASAVCTPSRYALLTGRYPIRAHGGKGVWGPIRPDAELLLDTETLTLGKVFQNQGYATACLGKWHLGFGRGKNNWQVPLSPGPNDVGFDYYFGVPVVNSSSPYVYVENQSVVGYDAADPLIPNSKTPTPTGQFPVEASRKSKNLYGGAARAHNIYDDEKTGTLLAEKAVEFITDNKERPFFLYLATTNIHHPFTPDPRFKGTSQCGLYGDFIHELDWIVGEVMQRLEDEGLDENTLVIFTSDNGGMLNLGGRMAMRAGHRLNGDLLGFKFGVWEGGHRVPFIARWPGQIEAGSESSQLICHVDLLATCQTLTNQDPDEPDQNDSIDILPALVGNPTEALRTELLLAPHRQSNLAVRSGKWLYINGRGSGGFGGSKPEQHAWGGPPAVTFAGSKNSDIENGRVKKDAAPGQLYDLESDLKQENNLYKTHPAQVRRMKELLNSYQSTAKGS